MKKVIYVLENQNGVEGAFTSLSELVKLANNTEDEELLACVVMSFAEDSTDEVDKYSHLIDYRGVD
ncbi:hypothetical protein [Salinicoccus halitifaciens]|uniref:Uncharacterized protein n=1 Tax=Salinicoccus halitifaciens TaxID=1073415 RepID=A0ABV2E6R3_9STAP|nr:hypothetical protein [Salinicoccus halitifaciens]MCD2137180.1 hypothetical protein [Salinicoccus halitifaciens]